MSLATLTLAALLAPTAQADTTTISCFQDDDGDGYWATSKIVGTNSYDWKSATDACAKSGGAEYRFAFDCDDTNAKVHPRAAEENNGKDDNCNGKIDEPTFLWPSGVSTTWHPDDNSLKVHVYVNDDTALDRGDTHGDLVVQWSYRPIDQPSWSQSVQMASSLDSSSPSASFTRKSLDAGTVYAFKAQLGVQSGNKFLAIGDQSDAFYGMTSDAGSDLGADVRTDIVVASLYNYYRSNQGYLGYMGTTSVDGTSNTAGTSGYGTARGGTDDGYERWCTETYVGHTEDFVLSGASGYNIPTNGHGGISSIGDLARWFYDSVEAQELGFAYAGTSCGNCEAPYDWKYDTNADAQSLVQASAQPGDWVHSGGHSTMYLGYDATSKRIWAIDGNGSVPDPSVYTDAGTLTDPAEDGSDSWIGDSNVISVRAFNLGTVRGVGLLDPSMF